MEDLQHIIDALIKQHGYLAVQAAVKNYLSVNNTDGTTGGDPVPPSPTHP